MMRLIRKHSDYAHIRIPICIRMYPNIFADADIKLHMYPILKSAWEKSEWPTLMNSCVVIGVG